MAAQGLQHAHEAVVAQPLELGDRAPAGLLVRLRLEPVEELVRHLWHVGQLRPRPLKRRPELRHEVPHPVLAAGDAVDLERPHDRPAEARAEADRIVDLLDRCHPVVDEPERLAPERLEQAVGDEAVDLRREPKRPHADGAVDLRGAVERLRRGALAAAELDEREQVDRVERVPDGEALGPGHVGLELRREEPGGRGRDHDLRPRGPARRCEQLALELDALGRALLDEVGIAGRVLRRRDEGQQALGRERRQGQPRGGPPRAREHLFDLPRRLGIRVVELDVVAVQQEARGPAAADHAPAEQPDLHAARRRSSFSRTSAGPSTRAFIPSRICTARSTSSPFDASRPRER